LHEPVNDLMISAKDYIENPEDIFHLKYPRKRGSGMARAKTSTRTLADILNAQIANLAVLYFKLHSYHWYVKGDKFFELHEKFEQLYNEAAKHIDVLAERLLALQGKPASTMRDFLALASVAEASGNETAEQMVGTILQDFTAMKADLKEGIRLAESQDDSSTVDILTDILTSLDKHIWMLSAYLGR